MIWRRRYKRGDWVVYRRTKFSQCPGPRAQEVAPAARGDTYSYVVDKYWTVDEVLADGRVRLRTRRGKEHVLREDDIQLRHARWWERLVYRGRFPRVDEVEHASPPGDEAAAEDSHLNQQG